MTVTGTMRLFSSQTWVMPSLVPSSPFTLRSKVMSLTSELDLDVDARRQVEPHERVDGLRREVEDVDEALVRAHLEVLAGVLVLVRRADDAVDVLLGRQRHRARDLRASTRHRLDDLARRAVDDLVVVGLEPDADLLSRHGGCTSCLGFVPLLTEWCCSRCGGGSVWAPAAVPTYYLVILVTRPAPTVRPPSRMAKRRPSSMAMGWMRVTFISVLSPGMTISVPSGRSTTPVTSVVRK